MKMGSWEHKNLFCESFLQTHRVFVPEELPWPVLDETDLEKIRGVPFWQEVLYTEMRAIVIIEEFSATVKDTQIRGALDMMAAEEKRHERLVRVLLERYQIPVAQPQWEPLSPDPKANFIEFGYGECVDSFIGFGFFRLARESNYFPAALFDIFDILMSEEIRHVLLIINWAYYEEARAGRTAPACAILSLLRYGKAVANLVKVGARNARNESDGVNFSATQASELLADFTVCRLLAVCLSENQNRLSAYHPELLRPVLLSKIAGAVLAIMNIGRWRQRVVGNA